MSRLALLLFVSVAMLLTLAGCGAPTGTPTAAVLATNAPPTGYPALLPSLTAPAADYPAVEPTLTVPPTAYPADESTPTEPAASATAGPSDTPVPSDTPAATATTGPVLITYRNYEIVPATTTVPAGTLVTFVIEGDLHQPYAGAAAPFIFEAPNNLQNTTWSITFNNARTLTILCGYHGNMTATLIVE